MILINVVLLALGLAGAFTAFFGDTLREGPTPFGRVTRVGWWSALFLVSAFSMGLVKEFGQYRDDQAKATKADSDAADALAARTRVESDLKVAKEQLTLPEFKGELQR